jgi:HlyD family secretion protein
MPQRIPGQGLLRGGGGIQTIQATGDGILTAMELTENRTVAAGQVVASISNVTQEQNTEAVRQRYLQAEQALAQTRASESGTIADLEAQRHDVEAQLKTVRDRRPAIAKLVDSRDLPEKDLIAIDNEIARHQSRITDFNIQITERRGRIRGAETEFNNAKIEYDRLTKTEEISTQVTSTISGRIVDVLKRSGDRVALGEVIAEVETEAQGQALEVVAFVPVSFGQVVAPGHPVQVTVAGIKREESGFLKGQVVWVSPGPVGSDQVAAITKDVENASASYQLRIAPQEDPTTISGYAWSTGKGPPQQIGGGVQVQIAVEVGERTPISLLIPYLRGMFGG